MAAAAPKPANGFAAPPPLPPPDANGLAPRLGALPPPSDASPSSRARRFPMVARAGRAGGRLWQQAGAATETEMAAAAAGAAAAQHSVRDEKNARKNKTKNKTKQMPGRARTAESARARSVF